MSFPVCLRQRSPRVEASPPAQPPFPVEAVVVEEDTFLVISAELAVEEPREHPLQLLRAVHEAEPVAPGSIVIRQGVPLQLLAVVLDLEQEPIWREEWVAAALAGVMEEVAVQHIRSLAVPLLGSLHGRLPRLRAAELIAAAIEAAPACLSYLWLMVDEDSGEELFSIGFDRSR